jgi:hypothetical protein
MIASDVRTTGLAMHNRRQPVQIEVCYRGRLVKPV